MKIIQYDPNNKASIFAEALVILLSGGTVVYPTETAYAIGADFFSPKAYRNVYEIKGREKKKPLPVIVPNMRYAETLVRFSPRSAELAAEYWPGPLTLVLPFIYHEHLPHHKANTLALRISSNAIAQGLTQAFGKPIISTSANISGTEASYSARDIAKRFSRARIAPDLIIDAGELKKVVPSTIVQDNGEIMTVLRPGPIIIPQADVAR